MYLGHGSIDEREVDAGLFEDGAFVEEAAHASAAVGAGTGVLLEFGLAVNAGNGVGDGELGLADNTLEFGAHGVVSVGSVDIADERAGY